MSTATIAGNNVRPISAIKADYAARLAGQPQSIIADAKAMLTWLPRKAYTAAVRAMQWLHVPQAASYLQRNWYRFIGVVGKGAFATEVLTSHWGQKSIVKGLEISAKVLNTTIGISWKVLTSPLRLFAPTKSAVTRVETAVTKANRKLTPNSGETFGPLQIARDIVGYHVSADRTYVRFARVTAVAVMTLRVTRQFVPAGWMRVAAYILDCLMIARATEEVLQGTWLGRKLVWQQAVLEATIEADVKRQTETVVAESTRITRSAAANTAAKLRQEADEIEAEGLNAAGNISEDVLTQTADKAKELRDQADSLEATAAKMDPAEPSTATAVAARPTPGPSVPSMGGRTPNTGPGSQSHQRQGSGKRSR